MKLSKLQIYLIATASIVVIALVLVITAVTVSFNDTRKAIINIGKVSYTEQSKEKIDAAQQKYDIFEKGLGATTTFTSVNKKVGVEVLKKAEALYVEQAIRDLNNNYLTEDVTDEEIESQAKAIRSVVDSYFKDGDYSLIANYSILQKIEAKYATASNQGTSGGAQESAAEEPEIC